MAGDNHGAETQENATAAQNQNEQETTQLNQVDYQTAIAERDQKIAALEEQVASAAKSVEAAEKLSAQIDELRAQSESDCLRHAYPIGIPRCADNRSMHRR